MTTSTTLGMPAVPAREEHPARGEISFTSGHHFAISAGDDPAALALAAAAPLSVILQVTKRCDFGCVFCSETLQLPGPVAGRSGNHPAQPGRSAARLPVRRGTAAAPRPDRRSWTCTAGFIVGLPTNATRGVAMAPRLAGKIAFANIGFDGPRATFRRVRGDYDTVMTGVRAFISAGVPISLSAVVPAVGTARACRTCIRSPTSWTPGN